MTHYERLKRKRLGDILVSEGVASQEAVIAALRTQKETHRLLSDILLDGHEVAEWDLARVIVDQYQLPFIDLSRYSLHKDLVESFPAQMLHGAACIPLDRFGTQVSVACQEVPSEATMGKIRQAAKGPVYFYVALSLEIRRHLHDMAPLAAKAAGDDSEDVEERLALEAIGEDTSWKSLFDAANESVLSERPEE